MPMVLERGLRGEVAGVVDVLQFLEDVAARQHVHGEATTSFLRLIILCSLAGQVDENSWRDERFGQRGPQWAIKAP
jgi:hypothetical protein